MIYSFVFYKVATAILGELIKNMFKVLLLLFLKVSTFASHQDSAALLQLLDNIMPKYLVMRKD